MYIFVTFMGTEDYYKSGPSGQVKVRLEEASGEKCLVVPYRETCMKLVEELRPQAIAMSGFGGHFEDRKIEWFFGVDEVMHKADLPMLCFCGSHQLMGFCFNNDIHKLKELRDQPMRKLKPNEYWPRRAGDPKCDLWSFLVAEGFLPVRQVKSDPLFAGLPKTMIMREAHYCEVKKLPPGFVLLATSPMCRVEAMRHKARPMYGTQFHPETFAEPWLHGKKLLANFAAIVKDFWERKAF
jgi:GMP synthase (glutamine-hydrolysing)